MSCYTCGREREFASLPPRENIFHDDSWRVAHAFDSALPGWLVMVPRRHVTALADLTEAEAATIGPLQWRLSRALAAVTSCVKTYVLLLAEAEGFEHLHFHIVPRMADQPADRRGPKVFGYLREPPDQQVPPGEQDRLAVDLSHALSG